MQLANYSGWRTTNEKLPSILKQTRKHLLLVTQKFYRLKFGINQVDNSQISTVKRERN